MRRLITTLVSTTLVAAVLTAAPASAQTAPDRDLRRDGSHFPVSIETTIPPGANATITTPTLGKSVDTLKVTVKPQSDTSDQQIIDAGLMTHYVGSLKTKGNKLLFCIGLHKLALQGWEDDSFATYSAEHAVLAILILAACLEAAGLLSPNRPSNDRATTQDLAAKRCAKAGHQLPATLVKTDTGFRLDVDGMASKAKKPTLKVGCRTKGSKVTYKVRAAKKGVPLRRVAGKRLSIGIVSPSDAQTSVPLKVTFATP